MGERNPNRFSEPVTIFHERQLPERATPVGYAALIDAFLATPSRLCVPLPRQLSAIGGRHRVVDTPEWRLYSPRYQPQPTLQGHLTFAMKYEGLDLAVLKRLFLAVGPADVKAIVRARPTGRYARRICFFTSGSPERHSTFLPRKSAPTFPPLIRPGSGEPTARTRLAIASGTTFRALPPFARSFSERRQSTKSRP